MVSQHATSMVESIALSGLQVLPQFTGELVQLAPSLQSICLEWKSLDPIQIARLEMDLSTVLLALAGTMKSLTIRHRMFPAHLLPDKVGCNRKLPGPLSVLAGCLQLKFVHLSMPFIYGLKQDVLFSPCELDLVVHSDVLDLSVLLDFSAYLTDILSPGIQGVSLDRHDCEKLAMLVPNVENLLEATDTMFPRLKSIAIRRHDSHRWPHRPHHENDFYAYEVERSLYDHDIRIVCVYSILSGLSLACLEFG